MVDYSELAPVPPGTHLSTSKRWMAELTWQHEEIGRSTSMTSTGNQTRVASMVAQQFTHYATTAYRRSFSKC